MELALAAAWHPRGELQRFLKIYPQLEQVYSGMAISLPPDADPKTFERLDELSNVSRVITRNWSWGRHIAVRRALGTAADYVQYADFDRLVRWVETQPDEWRQMALSLQSADCTIFGRSERAWESHPQALRQTERIANLALAGLLGGVYDLSAGSKGLSRRAAEFILANSPVAEDQAGRALGTDAEWPVLLRRGGFVLKSLLVDGLGWESADRYRAEAASPAEQRLAAQAYDADPKNWEGRVQVALEIVEAGLAAAERLLFYP
ncbi:MAG TPA: hypothetical protein VE136_05155 [Anaerolineales bacterium]|jgi:hypothetical protein|nr:hypothetical protein [Anaerolineales bacterium]